MDKTAVVILNYNGVDYLRRFLPGVIENSTNCQVVIIDNHSTDSSVEFLQLEYPEIQLVRLAENYGYSGGYNRGLQQVEADNYILLNSDVEVTDKWAESMISFMESHPEVAVCQPKILSLENTNHFDYAGAAGGFLDLLGYPYCRGRIFNHLEEDRGQYDNSQLIFWAGGACFFIRAAIFKQMGGFDEDFFAHMEEIDLCWRIKRAGYQTAYVGESRVFHLGGGTLKETNPFKTYLNFRNGLQLLLKNCSMSELLWKLPLRMGLDLIACVRFLLLGSLSHAWAVLKAESVFLLTCSSTWGKRNHVVLPYTARLQNKIIIWEYFIKGKRTYEQLSNV